MRYLLFCYFYHVLMLAFLSKLGSSRENDVTNPDNSNGYKLCSSQICEEAGNELIKSLDQSVNPCDNFYKHACGGWIANHPIPETLEAASQRNFLVVKSQAQLREMLQKNDPLNSEMWRKVTDYYHSCENLAAIDARGLEPLESLVLANGGWPLTVPTDNWTFDDQMLTLQKIHENYAKVVARSALFVIQVLPDLWNTSVNLLQLKSPTVPIHRQRSFVSQRNKRYTKISAYANYTEAVASEFARLRGLNVPPANIENDVIEILKFEISLNTLYSSVPADEFDNVRFYRVTTIAEIQNTWNSAVSGRPEYAIDWLETIRRTFDGTDIVIEATEKIALSPGNIVENLADLLKKNSLRTVVNYVHWHAIDSLMSYTNNKMREITNSLFKELYGYDNNDDQRSIFCISHHKMLEGLSYAYVRRYFGNNSSLTTAVEMVSQIQMEMKQQFDQSTWMDDETKFRSKEKVDNMMKNIGYPSWYDEPGKIDEYYSELAVGPDYFENVVNYNRFEKIKSLKKLRKPFDRYKAEWEYKPLVINAGYTANKNSITFPAVTFQMPYFHAERPLVMNYGSMGILIGHEISHGFDNHGIMYDKIGNKKQWWSDSMIAIYNEKTKCFVDQYSNYTLSDNRIDGEQTLGENIADNIGISIALKAYLSYKKEHNLEDIRIPVLENYTDEKLFFYSLSNRFCASERPQVVATFKDSEHSPNLLRINGMVSNMQEFSSAFNCPSGSPMNPVKKCVLWG